MDERPLDPTPGDYAIDDYFSPIVITIDRVLDVNVRAPCSHSNKGPRMWPWILEESRGTSPCLFIWTRLYLHLEMMVQGPWLVHLTLLRFLRVCLG